MKLTAHEYRVLSYLMHHRGRVVSQAELAEHIYAQDADRDSNTVEVFVARLRRKLGAASIRPCAGSATASRRSRERRARSRRASSSARSCGRSGCSALSHLAFVYVTQSRAARAAHPALARVLGVLALVFMLGGLRRCVAASAPINDLRQRLVAVRQGRARRLEGDYPSEVQPLVDDLNALLDSARESRARARRPRPAISRTA